MQFTHLALHIVYLYGYSSFLPAGGCRGCNYYKQEVDSNGTSQIRNAFVVFVLFCYLDDVAVVDYMKKTSFNFSFSFLFHLCISLLAKG